MQIFSTQIHDIIVSKKGVAIKLLYQVYVALKKKKVHVQQDRVSSVISQCCWYMYM